jgi:hypothetical protein
VLPPACELPDQQAALTERRRVVPQYPRLLKLQ